MTLIPWRRKHTVHETDWRRENALVTFRDEFDALWRRYFRDPFEPAGFDSTLSRLTAPSMDMTDAGDVVNVTMELPGVQPADVEIKLSGDMLTVSGEKRGAQERKTPNCHVAERSFGRFHRSVRLPSSIDPEKVKAEFKDGVLTVSATKRAGQVPKRIEVRNAK